MAKFKPELIGIDEHEITHKKRRAKDTCAEVNQLISELEAATGYQLSLPEKQRVLSYKMSGVLGIIRDRLKMPVQKTETVFDFAGLREKDISPIFNKYRSLATQWVPKFECKNGLFIVPSSVCEEIEKEFTYYTSNSKQNEALQTIKELADALEKAIDNGLLSVHHSNFQSKRKALIENWIHKPLRVVNGKLAPNWYAIKAIKE